MNISCKAWSFPCRAMIILRRFLVLLSGDWFKLLQHFSVKSSPEAYGQIGCCALHEPFRGKFRTSEKRQSDDEPLDILSAPNGQCELKQRYHFHRFSMAHWNPRHRIRESVEAPVTCECWFLREKPWQNLLLSANWQAKISECITILIRRPYLQPFRAVSIAWYLSNAPEFMTNAWVTNLHISALVSCVQPKLKYLCS
jgi:hypothetical protein